MGEFYQLASKNAALEAAKPDMDLSESEEYTRLADRLDELDAELRGKNQMVSEVDIRSLLDLAWSQTDGD